MQTNLLSEFKYFVHAMIHTMRLIPLAFPANHFYIYVSRIYRKLWLIFVMFDF